MRVVVSALVALAFGAAVVGSRPAVVGVRGAPSATSVKTCDVACGHDYVFFSRLMRIPPLPAEVTVIFSITTPGPGDGRRSGGARSSRLGPPSGPRVPPQVRAGTTAVRHASETARRAARTAAYSAAEAHHEAALLQQSGDSGEGSAC